MKPDVFRRNLPIPLISTMDNLFAPQPRLETMSWRNAFAALMLASIAVAGSSSAATSKDALRGQTWDSIKNLPDWSGMWTPGRAPPGADSLGSAGGMFGL